MSAITFKPLYMQRIWGGRNLETIYNRELPDASSSFGEAWDIVDRDDAQSIVCDGEYAGKSLHDLWQNHRDEIFGKNLTDSFRFPLLIKILDSTDDLSIQVHPPAHLAEQMHGEPKTEMWFIANAAPGAKLHIGLKQGVTRRSFEQAIIDSTVGDIVHSITPQKGDSLLIESGRLHAIGAGFLIHEIQQNSDTTYRVFDWNRTDANGKPRDLHISESLACIDFSDIEPEINKTSSNPLVSCQHFITTLHQLSSGQTISNPTPDQFSLLTIVTGSLDNIHVAGQTILLPKSSAPLVASAPASVLQITIPPSN
jgi:mannose-6-phosphate isomerase